jgi:hypothetical protein
MNDNHEKPYALTCEPSIYTEKEMQIMFTKLETLKTDFDYYRTTMQDRAWDAKRILTEIRHNVETERQLQILCTNNSVFSQDYNRARVRDVLLILNDDNINKLKLLEETQT